MKINTKTKIMHTYHITFFIHRGNAEAGIKTLLGGVTLEAESIILAIAKFLNEHKGIESEIKYIVEL